MTDHRHTRVDPIEGSSTWQGPDADCPFCRDVQNQLDQTTFNQEVAVDQIVRNALTRPKRLGEIQILLERAYREGLSVPTGEFGIEEWSKEADDCWRRSKALQSLDKIRGLM